jgi:arginyl-tRNA synthetase
VDSFERIEVAGPGFVNLFLADAGTGMRSRACWPPSSSAARPPAVEERVMVEFVSANPTGPLTAAGGRHAAYGDSLARLNEAVGHEVSREYYVNDAGGQIDSFAASIAARMTGAPPPEGGYEGDYVAEIGERLTAEGVDPNDLETVARRGVELMLEEIRAALHDYRADFDSWFSERELHESSAVEKVLDRMRRPGTPTRATGPCGFAAASLGTTRTACWSAPGASRPTSPPTSPTTRTSSTAASGGWRSCSEPTTMATRRACARRWRRSAPRPAPTRQR